MSYPIRWMQKIIKESLIITWLKYLPITIRKVAKFHPQMKETGSEEVSAHWSHHTHTWEGSKTDYYCCQDSLYQRVWVPNIEPREVDTEGIVA